MRKYYQYFGLALIMIFAFYYTDTIASIVLNKNPLMLKINAEKQDYEELAVNAIIEGEYIIPGINGKEVNARESFYNMQELKEFNSLYLIYDVVKPEISLEDNKDKIIQQGNPNLNQISLVLESNNSLANYLKEKKYQATLLTNLSTYTPHNYFEVLNNETTNFSDLENKLNLNKENKHICLINDTNKENCLKNHNYLVKPTLVLDSNSLIQIKNNLNNGSIILIKDNAKLEDLILLLKEINFKDLKVVYLSELITEQKD